VGAAVGCRGSFGLLVGGRLGLVPLRPVSAVVAAGFGDPGVPAVAAWLVMGLFGVVFLPVMRVVEAARALGFTVRVVDVREATVGLGRPVGARRVLRAACARTVGAPA